MKILHICAGWQPWNGAANIARLLMAEQAREGHAVSFASWAAVRTVRAADEVWIHCGWLPCLWWAAAVCYLTQRRRVAERVLKWMPEGCYDPVRLKYHAWKKWLAGPVERWCLRRCARIVATCAAEKGWIKRYLGRRCPPVEVTDIRRFFDLKRVERVEGGVLTQSRRVAECAEHDRDLSASLRLCVENKKQRDPIHLLYLGRHHPLKGLEYLEAAVAEFNSNPVNPVNPVQKTSTPSTHNRRLSGVRDSSEPRRAQASAELNTSALSASQRLCVRFVSNAFGEELEKVWQWCDVLILPTLSENFGLVIAEALARGKRVITTDGAPAWEDGLEFRVESLELRVGEIWSGYNGRLIYLKGYRDGTKERRVELLKCALASLVSGLTSQ